MERPTRLWEQYQGKAFAEAMRGSGIWPAQPHACDLEPPWDEFDRRNLTLWDCMLHGWEAPWEGSWINRLFSPGETVLEKGRAVVLPEVPSSDVLGLTSITAEQFPEDESTIAKSEEFLRSLPNLSRPVSFELLGMGPQPEFDHELAKQIVLDEANGRKRPIADAIIGWTEPYTVVQFVADQHDAQRVERQLLAHYPNSAIVAGSNEDVFGDCEPASGLRNGHGYGGMLAMHHYWCCPLRTFTRLDPDPLGVAIAAMEQLDRDDWAMLQVLFQPATEMWAETIHEAITDPYNEREYLLPELNDRMLREKLSSPLFAVSVRLLSSRRDVFRQLEGWAEQFSAPPQGFWSNDTEWQDGQLSEYERDSLAWSVQSRSSYRPGLLLNVQELASLVHLPGRSIVSERLRQVKTRTKAVAESTQDVGSVLLGENLHRGKTRLARIPPKLRERHCYIAGASGTGKSTLLLNMIMQDIEAGHGVGLLDPHGDLLKGVMRRIPPERVDDVVLFDPVDEGFPFSLNILAASGRKERERLVEETVTSLRQHFPDSWGPRLQRILTFTLRTVLDAIPDATLADVERMLIDARFRDYVIEKTRNPRYVSFWKSEFGFLKGNAIDPVLNKLSVFLLNPTVRNIICQRRCSVDFDDLINNRKILLANLSVGLLTEEIAGTFGSFLVSKIVGAAFRRAAIPEERRVPWYLYVDEFQSYMNLTIGFEQILSQARKYKLVLAGLANQYVGQLSPTVRQAIFGNIGTMIVFRLGMDDARMISKEMGVFSDEEIMNLEVGEAIARAGGSATAFNLRTYREPEVTGSDPTRRIVETTRQRFARPRRQVETMLESEDDRFHEKQREQPNAHRERRRESPKRAKSQKRQRSTPHRPPRDPNEDDLVV